LALVLLLPALAAAAMTLHAGYRHDRAEIEKHLLETTRALSLVVDRQFGQAEALIWALSALPQLRTGDYAGFDALARQAMRLPSAWVVVEEPGRQVVNTRLPPGAALPETGSTEYWAGLVPGQVRVSNLFTGLVAQRPTISVDTLVERPDGTRLLVIVIMPAQTISAVLADQNLPPDWTGAIVDRQGVVVARSRDPDRFVGQPATPDNLDRIRAGLRQGVFESVSLDGVKTVLALSRSPSSGWSTIVAVPRHTLSASAVRSAIFLAAVGGILLAFGAVLALRIGSLITRPVAALVADAQALGTGGGEAAFTPAGGEFRETAALREAFAESRDALARRAAERDQAYAALRQANESLEQRVAERTQALGEANRSLRASQLELAEREALYSSVFRVNADGLFVVRVGEDERLTVEAYNPPIEFLTGIPPEVAAGRPLAEVVPPALLPLLGERIRECIAAGEPITYERRFSFPSRTGIWLVTLAPIRDAEGRIVRVLGATHDVTAEREAEREIREGRDRYSALFEHSPLDLAVVDVQDGGRFVYEEANPSLLRSFGIPAEHFVGRTPDEVLPPEVARLLEGHYRTCVETRSIVDYELAARIASREAVRRSVLVPIVGDDGNVRKIFVTSMDLTEQRLMEERLRQAQRLEAVGQLTGGIAHDFNNLLTVVMGNLDLLRRAKPERMPRLVDNALAAVEQGRRLTSQLLAFSRRHPLRPETVRVGALIGGMGDMLAQSLRGDITLELELSEDLWPAEVDPGLLQAALINLAANARDAMPRGGVFRVRARNTVSQDAGRMERIAIEVSDTGVGIPSDDLSKVFEPFFTTKPVGQGTGLGLAQVYGFVQQSGGSVDIRSEVGRGTTVTLLLPRAAQATAPEPASPVEREPGQGAPARRILLVEDNASVAELAEALLTDQGHRVARAASAREALAILDGDGAFDLVFSDLVMPGDMDGLDLALAIRRRDPGLPVLLATGYSEAAARVGEEGFRLLSKPYHPRELEEVVQELLAGDRPSGKVVPLRPKQA
jgi:PAS domain S-box-containing protein